MRARHLLLVALLLAGCASSAPEGPIASDQVEEERFRLEGALDAQEIRSGQVVVASFTLTNLGTLARYETGGCGTMPWRFEIVAPDGARVGPLGPDARCLGPPHETRSLPSGETLSHALSWDGVAKSRDDAGEVQRTPAEPGRYELRASVDVERNGDRAAPTVQLAVVVVE